MFKIIKSVKHFQLGVYKYMYRVVIHFYTYVRIL